MCLIQQKVGIVAIVLLLSQYYIRWDFLVRYVEKELGEIHSTQHLPNNLFKSDSQRVAFLLCVAFSV